MAVVLVSMLPLYYQVALVQYIIIWLLYREAVYYHLAVAQGIYVHYTTTRLLCRAVYYHWALVKGRHYTTMWLPNRAYITMRLLYKAYITIWLYYMAVYYHYITYITMWPVHRAVNYHYITMRLLYRAYTTIAFHNSGATLVKLLTPYFTWLSNSGGG
ncbi:hypothetical protein DPMN_107500 [Dreissena polymorpha]|uniref:Uncharacterized protein n=1 Tax=Dreissena polymorpha TaxID=45954 RepID=A0A9D4QK02_DREPO|nr:hypothetical protein DPMN_107500 [Dreissena polymorpha]